ncbi:MAG: tRNA (adenosine(37)-N6)-dimethylallyltransferase MiaA, partial [Gammaproteobacteria bacterium]
PALHAELARVDPEAAARIHPNDPQRIQRALEVHRLTGRPLSELQRRGGAQGGVRLHKAAVAPADRERLRRRIAERFEAMLAEGLVEEVARLRRRPELHLGLPALKSVGYRQVWRHLAGELSYEEMRARAIMATRQLAKRQLTWLRAEPGLRWFRGEPGRLLPGLAAWFQGIPGLQ